MDTAVQSRTLDSKPIAPSLFAHFVLRSSNMPAMVDWYATVLNMHVVQAQRLHLLPDLRRASTIGWRS